MKFIAKLSSIVLTSLAVLTLYMIYKINILPTKYLLVVSIILFLIILFLDIKLIRKKTKLFSRFFFIIISIGCSVGIAFLLSYLNSTYDFMNSLAIKDYEVVTYDVISKTINNIDSIKKLENKTISYLEDDKNYEKIKLLVKKDIKYKDNKYKNIDSLVSSLEEDKTDSIIIEENRYNVLKEEYPEFGNITNVVKQYKIFVKKDKNSSNLSTTDSFVMYISGVDTYGEISSVSRSDVNILAVVNPKEEKILLVSIPRDYYVDLAGTNSKDKLTHAGMYGIDTSIKTIENLLDIDINYYVRLNFSTLTKSIDLLGGVDVYSDTTFTSYIDGSITINEGMNHMDGKTALAFARERYAYSTGDRHRGENQQAIITALINQMTSTKNINKYKDLLSSLEGTFETSMPYKNISNLLKLQLDKNIKYDIKSISLDGYGSYEATYSMGSRELYVMIPDEDTVSEAQKEIKTYLNKK